MEAGNDFHQGLHENEHGIAVVDTPGKNAALVILIEPLFPVLQPRDLQLKPVSPVFHFIAEAFRDPDLLHILPDDGLAVLLDEQLRPVSVCVNDKRPQLIQADFAVFSPGYLRDDIRTAGFIFFHSEQSYSLYR